MKMFVFCKQWSNVRQWIKCHIFVKTVYVYTWSVSTISFFIWRHAYFRDSKIHFTHLSNFACTIYIMVQHISGNTYHITDIGNVNNITVTYWEYSYNGWLCWGLTSQSTIFQSCRDGAIASWVINQYFRGVKCLAQGHNTAEVGLEPRTSRSGVRHSTTEPPRSPIHTMVLKPWETKTCRIFSSMLPSSLLIYLRNYKPDCNVEVIFFFFLVTAWD